MLEALITKELTDYNDGIIHIISNTNLEFDFVYNGIKYIYDKLQDSFSSKYLQSVNLYIEGVDIGSKIRKIA